jgi:pyruvate/2-oxoglutarate dehydrogenase complex dihydrolipoamide acyltransferase (E2) component
VRQDNSGVPVVDVPGGHRRRDEPAPAHGIDGQVTVRDVPDLTIAIDHNVVDGAPATRFCAGFRELLESAAVMSPSSISLPALGYG